MKLAEEVKSILEVFRDNRMGKSANAQFSSPDGPNHHPPKKYIKQEKDFHQFLNDRGWESDTVREFEFKHPKLPGHIIQANLKYDNEESKRIRHLPPGVGLRDKGDIEVSLSKAHEYINDLHKKHGIK
jgi:hypothetical protein